MNQTTPNLDELFDGAQPRPRPTAEERAAAFQGVHAHWKKTVAMRTRQRQRRMTVGGLLAASLVLAISLLWPQRSPTAPVTVATIERIHGDVLIHTPASSVWRPLTPGAYDITAGTQLRTLDGALRVSTHDGGSVRIDAQTVVRFAQEASLSVDTGRLYYDSGIRNAQITITTPLGTIRNIGTQFSVRLGNDTLAIAVRTGATVLHNKLHGDAMTRAGQRRTVFTDGTIPQLEDLDDGQSQWAWADALGARFALGGQSALDYLQWLEQETGRTVRFRDQARFAASTKFFRAGSANADTSHASIQATLGSVDLQVEQTDNELVISVSR